MGSTIIGEVDPIFSALGPRMSLFVPPISAQGELIILCTWLGAGKKHIGKYVGEYRKIAPHARILLIESSVSIVTAPYVRQWAIIKPASEVVRAVLDECGQGGGSLTARPKILIHTFSNGGGFPQAPKPATQPLIPSGWIGTNSATQLLLVLQKQLGHPLPLSAIICDSGPARGTYWKSYHSMTTSLPKGLFWQIVGPVVVIAICNILFGSQWLGWEKPENVYRRTLLDGTVVNCKRICYIFSRADTHVDCADVTSHAAIASRQGWAVKQILFEDTPHCNHISKYRAEYVDAVMSCWKEAVDKPKAP
jgi:hypothetical protein